MDEAPCYIRRGLEREGGGERRAFYKRAQHAGGGATDWGRGAGEGPPSGDSSRRRRHISWEPRAEASPDGGEESVREKTDIPCFF